MFNLYDFNFRITNNDGNFIRIEELNKMVECGIVTINKDKLEKYRSMKQIKE